MQDLAQDLNDIWRLPDQDKIESFTLADLWDCYDEWSAYGIGIPLKLDDGENITQYYVPYLSAIHIYTSKSLATSPRSVRYCHLLPHFPLPFWIMNQWLFIHFHFVLLLRCRSPKEDTDSTADLESDCWSTTDDSEHEILSRSLSNNSSKTWDTISDDSSSDPGSSLPTKNNHLGYLYLQYNEICSPHWRIPLMDKVALYILFFDDQLWEE